MKRNKVAYPIVKPVKPWFWKECTFCNREFKKEQGYIIEDYTVINAQLYRSYCCNECAKSIEDVKILVEKSKIKLPPSPAPFKIKNKD